MVVTPLSPSHSMHISTEQKAFVHVSQGDAHSCPEAKVMLRTPSCPPQRSLAHAAAGLAEADSWNGRDSSELRTAGALTAPTMPICFMIYREWGARKIMNSGIKISQKNLFSDHAFSETSVCCCNGSLMLEGHLLSVAIIPWSRCSERVLPKTWNTRPAALCQSRRVWNRHNW